MKEETYLSSELDSANLKAQYDEHVKRLLKDKGVLAYILISVVDEFKNYTLEEAKLAIDDDIEVGSRNVRPEALSDRNRMQAEAIAGMENESMLPGEGKMTFDIVFKARTRYNDVKVIYVNIEAQKDFYPGYDLVTRGIIYSARLLSQQMDVEYTARNYDGVKKEYSIWICMNCPEQNSKGTAVANTITKYSFKPMRIEKGNNISEADEGLGRYDLQSIVFICLGKDKHESKDELIGMLSTLLSSKINTKDKKKELESKYKLSMTRDMEKEASRMCNLSMAIEEEALEKGIEKGIEKERLSSIQKLMQNAKLSFDEACDLLGIEDREAYREKI